jgi:tetratricopeptide (TPR) repeat protein
MGETRAALAECEIVNQRVAEIKDSAQVPLNYTLTYAITLARMGRPVEALTLINGAIDQAQRAGNSRSLTQGLYLRGSTLIQLERWDEADIALHEAATRASGGGEYRHTEALIESYMVRSDAARGNLDSAHRHRDRSLEVAGYHTQNPQRSLGRVLLNVAEVALAEHATADAEQFARDALTFYEAIARGPSTSADVGQALLRLAQARKTTGSRAELRSMLERAVECLTNGLAPDHPLTAEARSLLASIR